MVRSVFLSFLVFCDLQVLFIFLDMMDWCEKLRSWVVVEDPKPAATNQSKKVSCDVECVDF